MPTARECVCCQEMPQIILKLADLSTEDLNCITEHPGFATVCLDVWVLQAAYFQYRQHYGTYAAPINE